MNENDEPEYTEPDGDSESEWQPEPEGEAPPVPLYPIGYNPPMPQPPPGSSRDEEGEQEPEFEEPIYETPALVMPVDDGKVDAEGSVWRLHFAPGQTPTDEQMLTLTSAVKVLKVVEESDSRITPMTNSNEEETA